MPNRKVKDEEAYWKAIKLLKDGKNPYEIADLIGFSSASVKRWAKREGIELPDRRLIRDERRVQIRELRGEGKTISQIARITKSSRDAIRQTVMDIEWHEQQKANANPNVTSGACQVCDGANLGCRRC